MTNPTPGEDLCSICARWPLALRPVMRTAIDTLPLEMDQEVCDQCLLAFWTNCARPKTKRA
jgi:hypothetical protein